MLADLGKSRVQIQPDFDNLFQPQSGALLSGEYDFRIHTDPTAKVPHRQPYQMTQSERNEFELQIEKLLVNGWVTVSHSSYVAPIIFVKKPDGMPECVSITGD